MSAVQADSQEQSIWSGTFKTAFCHKIQVFLCVFRGVKPFFLFNCYCQAFTIPLPRMLETILPLHSNSLTLIGWIGNCQSSLILQWLFRCKALWWSHTHTHVYTYAPTHTHQKLLDHDKFLSTAPLNWFVKRRSSLILVPPQIPIRKMHSPSSPPGQRTPVTDARLFKSCILILPDASLQSSALPLHVVCQYIFFYLCQLFTQRGKELELRASIRAVKVLIFGDKWLRENSPRSFVIAGTKKEKMLHCRKEWFI